MITYWAMNIQDHRYEGSLNSSSIVTKCQKKSWMRVLYEKKIKMVAASLSNKAPRKYVVPTTTILSHTHTGTEKYLRLRLRTLCSTEAFELQNHGNRSSDSFHLRQRRNGCRSRKQTFRGRNFGIYLLAKITWLCSIDQYSLILTLFWLSNNENQLRTVSYKYIEIQSHELFCFKSHSARDKRKSRCAGLPHVSSTD